MAFSAEIDDTELPLLLPSKYLDSFGRRLWAENSLMKAIYKKRPLHEMPCKHLAQLLWPAYGLDGYLRASEPLLCQEKTDVS